jgi:prophage tail gpP-like protein
VSDEITLSIGGVAHGGWQELSVTLSIEDPAASFSFEYRDRYGNEQFPIREGDACEIKLGDELLVTGYIDETEIGESGADDGVRCRASGRSRIGDLADCSAFYAPALNRSLLDIGKDLCLPFGIGFSLGDPRLALDTAFRTPIERFAVEATETPFEALSRLVRFRGAMLVSTPQGDLQVVRAGSQRISGTTLTRGVNLLSWNWTGNARDRYSKYTARGQGVGSDQFSGRQIATVVKTVDDPHVARFRPLTIMADDAQSASAVEQRATWERNLRAARAERFTCDVRGWRHAAPSSPGLDAELANVDKVLGLKPTPTIWLPNRLVRYQNDVLGVDADLLIVSVTLSLSIQRGTRASLTLGDRAGYDVQTVPEPKIKRRKRRKKKLVGSLPGFNAVTGLADPSQDPIIGGG